MEVLKLLSVLLLAFFLLPGLSRVVNKFSDIPECEAFFLEKTTPNIPGVLVDGVVLDQNRYRPICQYFQRITKNNVKKYTFATLYDTENKIPVFSAYTFTGIGSSEDRPSTWMIEPQLENEEAGEVMQEEVAGNEYTRQAVNEDYDNDGKNKEVNKGHVFPKGFAHQPIDQLSTFTLTNAVPQNHQFNGGSWRIKETMVRKELNKNCIKSQNKAYLVTGAVPSRNPEKKLNNRVNIPSFMWTAYCCYDRNTEMCIPKAYWGANENKGETTDLSLKDLNEKLKEVYNGDVQVFPTEPTTVSE